jgi:hypothetical protein
VTEQQVRNRATEQATLRMSSHIGEIVMNTLINMNTRTSIVALAACTLVAAMALAPTSASAWGGGFGHGAGGHWGGYGGHVASVGGGWQSHQSWGGQSHQSWVGYHPSWRPAYNTGYWHRPATYWTGVSTYVTPSYAPAPAYTPAPVTYVAPVTYAPTTYAPPAPAYTPPAPAYAPAPATYAPPAPTQGCNCLSKTYMQDGTAVFSDNCTKETAMLAPTAPQQQTGYQPH